MDTVDPEVARRGRWSPHLLGHLLLFDRRPAPALTAHAGFLLLVVAGVLEFGRVTVLRWLSPGLPAWLLAPTLLALACWAVRGIAGVRLSRLGLVPWREWTMTERSYFLQVMVLANVVFPIVLAEQLRSRPAAPGIAWSLGNVFVPYLCFGFYQELVYRGLVQRELVRRWTVPIGIVVANVLFTFGPLHWNYFAAPATRSVPMFAAIFAIGLFFGILYERSGNLWIVASFHALGNAYILWGVGPASPA